MNTEDICKKMYAIVSSEYPGVFFTGGINVNGTPNMTNTPEKAKLFTTPEEASNIRSIFKTEKTYNIREVEVRIIPGYIVKEC